MPLVEQPISKQFVLEGGTSKIEVTVVACPNQAVKYRFDWPRKPANGVTARCRGQVTLLRRTAKKAADQLPTITALSSGQVYAGSTDGNDSYVQLKGYQLHEVDDFDFWGEVSEEA